MTRTKSAGSSSPMPPSTPSCTRFSPLNFTVVESTPLDIEVAVDPEMLGKVFEELVTGRHESGSYYTPKPIVSFMCREAIKGYLQTRVPRESAEAIASLVDRHNPAELRNGEAVPRRPAAPRFAFATRRAARAHTCSA